MRVLLTFGYSFHLCFRFKWARTTLAAPGRQCRTHLLLYHPSVLLGLNLFTTTTTTYTSLLPPSWPLCLGPSPLTLTHSLSRFPPHLISTPTASTCRSLIFYNIENQSVTRRDKSQQLGTFFSQRSSRPSIVTPSSPDCLGACHSI